MRLEGSPTVMEFDPFQQQVAGAVNSTIITGGQIQYGTTHNVGEGVRLADGRMFRYTLAGTTALVAGTMNTPPAEKSNHYEVAPASAVTSTSTPARVVNKQVTVTLGATAATQNEYTHGFANWSSGSNVGIPYEISYNPAANQSTTMQLTFFDFLQADVATGDTVDLVHSQWYNILQSTGSSDQTIRGAGVSLIAVTAAYSCWVVTHGLVGCIADGTIAVGTELVLSNSSAGAVTGRSTTWSTAVAQINVGYLPFESAIATNSKPVFLTID